jgi:hypothetical protein
MPIPDVGVHIPPGVISGEISQARHTALSPSILAVEPAPGSISPFTQTRRVGPCAASPMKRMS